MAHGRAASRAPHLLVRNSSFRWFWLGQFVSEIGSTITLVVLPLIVLDLTRQPFYAGIVSMLAMVPYSVLGFVVGVYVDRWHRKRIMQMADLCRLIAYGSVPVAHWLGMLNLYQLFAVALVSGTAHVFYSVAEVSSVPAIVEDKSELSLANSLTYSASNLASLFGPPLGGFLYSLVGGANAISLDALSYAFSLITLALIPREFESERPPHVNRKRFLSELLEGLRYLWSDHAIRALAVIIAAANLVGSPLSLYAMVFARDRLQAGPLEIGLLVGLSAIGGILGSLAAYPLQMRLGFNVLMALTFAAPAVAGTALPFSPNVTVMIPLLAVYDVASAIQNVAVITFRQSTVADDLLGRVNSAFRTIVLGVRPLGLFFGSFLVQYVGPFGSLMLVGLSQIPILLLAVSQVGTATICVRSERRVRA